MSSVSHDKLNHPIVLQALFHPRREIDPMPLPGVEEHFIEVEKDVRIGARFHLAAPESPHILFFHGNGEIAADWDDAAPHYTNRSISFLAVDYRGYGRSGGEPSASTMMEDCHAVFRYVRRWFGEKGRTGPIFPMGRSLGSASAIEVASTFTDQIGGVIIESGFAQTMPLLLTLGVDVHRLGITEMDGFQNVQKIARVAKPTLIIHGQHDQLIPATSAEILQVQSPARNKEFQLIPGADHNTLLAVAGERYFDAIRRFLDRAMSIRPNRYRKRT